METCTRVRTEMRTTGTGEPRFEIWLSGEVDLDWRDDLDQLVRAFGASDGTEVVIHCHEISFLSSIGVSALFRLADLAGQRGGGLILSQSGDGVRRTLELAGLQTLITID